MATNTYLFNPELLIGDAGSADIDWEKFNLDALGNDKLGHPSSSGYRMIAEYIANHLKVRKVFIR